MEQVVADPSWGTRGASQQMILELDFKERLRLSKEEQKELPARAPAYAV